jgi:hypothetical protein
VRQRRWRALLLFRHSLPRTVQWGMLLHPIFDSNAPQSGLRWTLVGDAKPQWGTELDNTPPALAAALAAGQMEFSRAEWSSLGVQRLRMHHFVKAAIPRSSNTNGDGSPGESLTATTWQYFKPVARPLGFEGPSDQKYMGATGFGKLAPDDPWRLRLIWLVESRGFQPLTLLMIVVNCVLMASQGPDVFATPEVLASRRRMDLLFTLFFSAELTVQCLALGFTGHDDSYLADPWNRLDFIVVSSSWVPLLFPHLDNVTAIRALRALRPLRTIRRLPKLKAQVDTIVESLPFLLDVALLAFFILTVYGVLGLSIYKGVLRSRCFELQGSDVDGLHTRGRTVGDAQRDVCDPRGSGNDLTVHRGSCAEGELCAPYGQTALWGLVGFDNIGLAWVTVARCITLEGWFDVFYLIESARPSPVNSAYFLSLVVFGGYYLLNLFLAVMVRTYDHRSEVKAIKKQRQRNECNSSASTPQPPSQCNSSASTPQLPSRRQRMSFALAASDEGESTPTSAPLLLSDSAMARFVSDPRFEPATTAVIALNTGVMMLDRHPIEPGIDRLIDTSNMLFTVVFALEMAAKICAHGPRLYWADPYNRFDGTIVVTSIFDIIAEVLPVGINTSFLRALRLLRVFRLLRTWSSLQQILTVFISIIAHELLWLLLLLSLVLFIFALLGMQVFGGQYAHHPDFAGDPPRHNFDSLTGAMLTVFIVTTGESWDRVWMDTQHASSSLTILYFLLLIFTASYLVLNLLTAVVFAAFQRASLDQKQQGGQRVVRRTPSSTSASGVADDCAGAEGGTAFTAGADGTDDDGGGDGTFRSSDTRARDLKRATGETGGGVKENIYNVMCANRLAQFIAAERSGYALGFLPQDHSARHLARTLLELRSEMWPVVNFENFIILCIVVSSFLMSLRSCDVPPGSALDRMLERADTLL